MTTTGEIWRPIAGFDYYLVSSHGRVRSLPRVIEQSNGPVRRIRGGILKVNRYKRKPCHYSANLYRDRRQKTAYVQDLVRQAFGGDARGEHVTDLDEWSPSGRQPKAVAS